MLHLPADRLAELVDIEPTPQELAHLQSCPECARERNALMALRNLAATERERVEEPLATWEALRSGLVQEGLIVVPPAHVTGPVLVAGKRRRFSVSHWSLRLAASFALVAGGVAAGRLTAPDPVQDPVATGAVVTASQPVEFASASDAMVALMRAQEDYQRAAAFLLASDTTLGPTTPTLYKQRLAALDELMGVTSSALARVPHDPVINSYYLAALGAREATLQQLELALPEGTRIDRF
jgi:hypothetical protein